MRLNYDLIVFDLEANQPSDKLIEIGAVKIRRDMDLPMDDHFSELIKIDEPLGRCIGQKKTITELTGITDKDLKKAKEFPEVLDKFEKWAKSRSSNILLASWGSYDTVALQKECERHNIKFPFRKKCMDIKSIVCFLSAMFGVKLGSEGLQSVMRKWKMEFMGIPHRAYNDAYNTAALLLRIVHMYDDKIWHLDNAIQWLKSRK